MQINLLENLGLLGVAMVWIRENPESVAEIRAEIGRKKLLELEQGTNELELQDHLRRLRTQTQVPIYTRPLPRS